MKLFQIEYLLAVCKYGSISRAADGLLVSRPAVSRAIKDLEDEFGVVLFQRTTTGVALTEAGTILYDKCLKIDRLLSDLQSEMEALRSGESDENDLQLCIGISYTARCCCLPFIADFRAAHPNIRLRLVDLEDAFLDSQTLHPDYDLEIALSGPGEHEGVGFINMEESSLAFCCSRLHPLAERSHVSIQEIQDEPLVGINHLEQKDNQVNALYARFGLVPNIAFMTMQVSFLRQMIKENLCSSVKPRQSMENDPDIITIPIDEAEKYYLRILWNASIRHNKAFHAFVEYARHTLPAP